MIKNLFPSLEKLIYGIKKFSLNIKIEGLETLMEITKEKIKHKAQQYKGDFAVTNKGYLIRNTDKNLKTIAAKLDFSESGNAEGLLNLTNIRHFRNFKNNKIRVVKYKEKDRVHIHYSDGRTDFIIRDWRGLRFESYVPLTERYKVLKIKIGEQESFPSPV